MGEEISYSPEEYMRFGIDHIKSAAVGAYLKATQERHLFCAEMPDTKPLYHPRIYEQLAPFQVSEDTVITSDKTPIKIWEKKGAPDEPHYILFHGNHGHWADTGPYNAERSHIPLNRAIRLEFLRDIAASGAGFTAVSLRGYGGSGGSPGEKGFITDVHRVIDHISSIPHERVRVAGESLGAAVATITAEELTNRGKPPAVLGLINPFTSMVKQTQDMANDHPAVRKFSITLSKEQVASIIRHPFDTQKRFNSLTPATQIFVGTSGADRSVRPSHSATLVEIARRRGLPVQHLIFAGKEHCTWPTTECVDYMNKLPQILKGAVRQPTHTR